MAANTKVLLEKGTGLTKEVQNIEIPDMWHLAMWLKKQKMDSEAAMLLTTWHTAHALKSHIIEH